MFTVNLLLLLGILGIYFFGAFMLAFNLYFEFLHRNSTWVDVLAITLVILLWPLLSAVVFSIYMYHRVTKGANDR